MAKLNINIGTTANDRTGDPLRTAFEKVNANFTELYAGSALEDRLTNGSKTVTLNVSGLTTFPTFVTDPGSLFIQGPEIGSETSLIGISAKDNVIITSNILTSPKVWAFGTDGVLTLPGTGTITNTTSTGSPTGTIYTFDNDGTATPGISSDTAVYLPSNVSSVSIQSGWIITFADSTQKTVLVSSAGTGPNIGKHMLTFSGSVLKIGSEVWPLTVQSADYSPGVASSSLELSPNGTTAWAFNSDGSLTLPSGATQTSTGSINCQPGVDTVVFTSSQVGIQTIKLVLQVEGTVTTGDADTQSCEMIVAKGFRGPTVAASVYGIVYTSVEPLATFTADWNPTLLRVEVTCQPTSLTNNVTVKAFATEITTSD